MNELLQTMVDICRIGATPSEDIQKQLASANEEVDHRLTDESLEDYAYTYQRMLEKAQRANPQKGYVPKDEGEF